MSNVYTGAISPDRFRSKQRPKPVVKTKAKPKRPIAPRVSPRQIAAAKRARVLRSVSTVTLWSGNLLALITAAIATLRTDLLSPAYSALAAGLALAVYGVLRMVRAQVS